jgi:hypothetical protein
MAVSLIQSTLRPSIESVIQCLTNRAEERRLLVVDLALGVCIKHQILARQEFNEF